MLLDSLEMATMPLPLLGLLIFGMRLTPCEILAYVD